MQRNESDKIETQLKEWLPDFSVLEPHLEIATGTPLALQKEKNLKEFADHYRLEGKDTRALIVGRFQPPHAGHLYLIEASLAIADQVVIGIGSANIIDEKNPFAPAYRERVLRHALVKQGIDPKRVTFIQLDDLGDNEEWGDMTYKKASKDGAISAVIGNSDWVNGIFETEKFKDLGVKVCRPKKLGRGLFNSTRLRDMFRTALELRPIGK